MPLGLGHVACGIELTLSNLLLIKIKWTWGNGKGCCVLSLSSGGYLPPTSVHGLNARNWKQYSIHYLNLIDIFWFSSFCFELFGLIRHLGTEGCWHFPCDCDWLGRLNESSLTRTAMCGWAAFNSNDTQKDQNRKFKQLGKVSLGEGCHN